MTPDRKVNEDVGFLKTAGATAVITLITLFVTAAWNYGSRLSVLETQFTYISKSLDEIKTSIKESK